MTQRIIHWLHLDVDILNDEKIDVIRSMPEGDSMFVVWIGLLCLAMKCCDNGYLYVAHGIPYTSAHLSRIFKIGKNTVDKAIQVFEKLEMISTYNGTEIEIINFEKHQGLDTLEKLREISRKSSAKYREKQRTPVITKVITKNKKESKSKTKRVTVTSLNEKEYLNTFNEFYKVYPKRKARDKALESWLKIKPNKELIKIIMQAINNQTETGV